MNDLPNRQPIGKVPINDLKIEQGAEDLLDSPAMDPYMNLALSMMKGEGLESALSEIANLPLEQRYVWRVASTLKWAFADFESVNVVADRKTLSAEDRKKLADLLKVRPLQFCLFLAALFGEKQMEALMINAIRNVRQLTATPEPEVPTEPEHG